MREKQNRKIEYRFDSNLLLLALLAWGIGMFNMASPPLTLKF